MSENKIKTILAFGAIYIIWGSTYLAIKYALESIPPFLMMGTRSLSAGIILILWSRFKEKPTINREQFVSLFIIGALFFLIGHGLLAWSQQNVPSGLASVLVASEPLWILLIEFVILKDTRVRFKGILGLIIGFAGIVYLILSNNSLSFDNSNFTGSVAVIIGALSWGTGAVYSRTAKLPRSAVLAAGLELIIGGTLLLIAALFLGEYNKIILSEISLRSLLGFLYLVIFGSVVSFSAYVWLLSQTSATRISTHTYVNPVIAVFLGWSLGGETITFALIAATAAVIISVYLVLHDQYQLKKIKNEEEYYA